MAVINHNQQSVQRSVGAAAVRYEGSLSFWLLLVGYSFLSPLGTLPVLINGQTYSAEFFFSILCVLVVAGEVGSERLNLVECNGYFVLGLALWLVANALSALLHPDADAGVIVFRMVLKALFGYMVFVVLMGNGRLKLTLISYVAGCAVAGLFTIAFCVETGSLEALRQSSFTAADSLDFDLDIFNGIARAGAGNLLPLWICIVLYADASDKPGRSIWLTLCPYFAALALLALRREVLVECAVGWLVLLFAVPKRYRIAAGAVGVVVGCSIAVFVAYSERWQDRLFLETREDFADASDPRMVLLMNTPREMMESPLLGNGPGSYRWRMCEYLPFSKELAAQGIGAHNSFSRAAVETGILGLLGFTLMVAALGWRACFRKSKKTLSDNVLRLAAIMLFLHLGDWLFFGDGTASNKTWYFMGVLLYLDRRLFQEDSMASTPVQPVRPATAR